MTDHDAHAWVEAWFRGYGWLPFDPTPPAGRPERGTLTRRMQSAATSAGRGGQAATAAAPAQAHRHGETGNSNRPPAAPPPTAVRAHGSGGGSLLLALVLLAAAALAGVVVGKQTLRRTRYLTRDPRRRAAACRRELADFLLDQRIGAARSATLHELGALVREELAVDPDAFVRAATAARFGPPVGAGRAARDARRELRSLVRRIRPRLTVRERVRGLVSVRSLGLAA